MMLKLNYSTISALTANLVTFVAGCTLTWSSPVIPKLKDITQTPFDVLPTKEELSWVSSLLPLGALFGPFIYGYLPDKIGRKYSLLATEIPFMGCFFILAFGKSIVLFYVARFITGIAVAGVMTVIPMYIGEIAENSNRGALGSAMNCLICAGLLFSYSLGPYVSVMAFNLVLSILPVIFIIIFFILGTESPYYYVSKGNQDMAKAALQKIRTGGDNVIERELFQILEKSKQERSGNFMNILRSKGLIKAFIISVGLLSSQQLSGHAAVMFYAQTIFQNSGASLKPEVCSIIIGGVQLCASFVAPLLVERLGRKILLIFSAVGMTISEVSLGVYSYLKDGENDVSSISFLPLVCLVLYIITFNCGLGPLPWIVMGEVFPSNVKSIAFSITAGIGEFISFFVTKYFEAMSDSIGMGPSFWLFAGFCIATIPFCYFVVIETKGKSLQEIQNELNH